MVSNEQFEHQRFSDELAAYALNSLASEERARLEQHLESCVACRRELEELRQGVAAAAFSALGPGAPQRARQRLLAAIAREPRMQTQPVPLPRAWWSLAPLFAAFALAIFTILLWHDNVQSQRANQALQAELQSAQQRNRHAEEVLAMMTAKDAAHITLVSAGAHPVPQVKTIYQRRSGHLLLMASNLAPLPPEKCYELWLVPMQGNPIPASMFKPDRDGSAMDMPEHSNIPAGTPAKAFAVTIEPDGGSATPTMPIVMAEAGQS